MKTLNDVQIIITGDNKVSYNYNGTLYTKEEFEDTYFPKANTPSKPQEEIEDVFDVEGNICIKLQVNDYVKFSFDNEYDQQIFGEGVITRANYNDNDRMEDCYVVKTNRVPHEFVIIYGRDIDRVWR